MPSSLVISRTSNVNVSPTSAEILEASMLNVTSSFVVKKTLSFSFFVTVAEKTSPTESDKSVLFLLTVLSILCLFELMVSINIAYLYFKICKIACGLWLACAKTEIPA